MQRPVFLRDNLQLKKITSFPSSRPLKLSTQSRDHVGRVVILYKNGNLVVEGSSERTRRLPFKREYGF